ncbi:phage nozzle protein [Xanthobacter aminoxidans]|uniref:phage nozzle protein n=1 Tax=Xanthobacter aminoxidans TaxID=186280 RepID=UPI002022FF4C|nr:hypothetical protein [Xanthobacter aminoxidans]MCL8384157.1 hypothetical protein [Xanthobacter aminoxidans]
MGLITGELPGLYNGVSQQAVAMRLPTQGELQENFDSTLVAGLKKRPPFEHVANIPVSDGEMFMHMIVRDETERYVLVIRNGKPYIFDFEGNACAVNAPSGYSYLSGGDGDYAALTVADYTFIVNRNKKVAVSSATFATRPYEALINILQGNYSKTYTVDIDGTRVAEYRTPGGGIYGSANCASTENIAQILMTGTMASGGGVFYMGMAPNGTEGRAIWGNSEDNYQIIDNAGMVFKIMSKRGITSANGWDVTRYTSAIYIQHPSADFSIAVGDGYNGNAAKVVKTQTQRFSDLPSFAPIGYTVEITGSDGTTTDSYWVWAQKDGDNDGNSQIIWKETCKPGSRKGLDASTMPHILVREADGSFTFKPASWNERECGDDEDVNPDPSFVGGTIQDVFFHHNRLGFLSDENVILSRSGDFFNFYRTTATAYLDDDPIDVAASHVKVSIMRHVVPTQDNLILFSDGTQFRLSGNETLTPKSVSLRPMTEFSSSPTVPPVAVGKSVFFIADSTASRDYAAVYDFFYDNNSETGDADNVTAHTPSYIPTGVTQIIGSPDESCLAVLTDGDPSAVYIHRFYWAGQNKVQSAWMRWTTAGTILRAAFIKSDIYALVARPGGTCLEKLRMSTSALDADHGYLIHLDRRVTSDQLKSPVYKASSEVTTYTLPFVPQDGIIAVSSGRMLDVSSIGGVSVSLKGDTRGKLVYFGYPYESRYRFSTLFARGQSADGSSIAKINGRLQLHHLALSFDKTGYFRVEVTPDGRSLRSEEYHGRVLGDSRHVFGTVKPENRRWSVPIMSRNDRVIIDLVNDSWLPSSFISASWRGMWNQNNMER